MYDFILSHAPILVVILPLLAAPLALLARKSEAAWFIAVLATGASFLLALHLFGLDEPLTYQLGGWAAPWGIVYVIDTAASLVLLIIAAISFIATFAARQMDRVEIHHRDHALFYTAWLLTIAGMMGQVTTGDAFNIFVFLEISSLSAYALVAMGAGTDRRALPAAFNYLILGTVGATFYVIGIGLLYMLTGTLNLADLAARLPDVPQTSAVFAAMCFISVGLFLKIALFPLHFWLAPAYGFAPSSVSLLMAATATKVSVYVLIRVLFDVFGIGFGETTTLIGFMLLTLGVIGALAGTLSAMVETDLKRLLAQSSIAQLGYMAMGIGIMSKAGVAASLIHLVNHALMKGALFLAVGAIAVQIGRVSMTTIAGAGRQIPFTMAAILCGGLALIGVPLTAGFISKLYLIRAQVEAELWLFIGFTILSSVLALVYVWRIIEAAYMTARPEGAPVLKENWPLTICAWVLVGATLYFGVQSTLLVETAQQAATQLVGGSL